MDPAKYADIFLEESREHLTTVNQQLLEWERDPASTEAVKVIFRAMHNLKGMAATMGYTVVATLAHRAETLLDHFRATGGEIDSATLQLLFLTTDGIEEAIERVVDGGEVSGEVSALVGRLDEAAARFHKTDTTPEKAAPAAQAEPLQGRSVRVVLKPETQLKGARATILLARLAELGTVGDVVPGSADIQAENFRGEFVCTVDTDVADDEIERVLLAGGDVATVEVGGGAEADQRAAKPDPRAGAKPRHLRVDLRRLDALMNLVGELVSAHGSLSELSGLRGDAELEDATVRIARITRDLQAEVNEARMTPAWQVFDRFPRLVRDVATKLGKRIAFRIEGKEIEVDKSILDQIGDPLVHLLRNAVDHGIESPEEREAAGKPPEGLVVLSAGRERSSVVVRVSDDGRGIDPAVVFGTEGSTGSSGSGDDLLSALARPGFSTAKRVSDISGRGVGIDAVVTQLQSLGGSVELRSQPARGATFTLRLPSTLAIVPALLANVDRERYALPLTHVEETVDLDVRSVTDADGHESIILRDHAIPLVRLRSLVGMDGPPPTHQPVVVVQIGERRSGLVVDRISGQRDIVVKSFTPPKGMVPIFSGATILGDGRAVLILDAARLV